MKFRTVNIMCLAWAACLCLLPAASAPAQDQAVQPVMVGRISHISGELLRYVPEVKDWVATVQDAPFGLNDALYSGDNARAEFIFPNGAWIRIGGNTQIQLITIEDNFTRADLAQGMARFYNQSTNAIVEISSPFGSVTATGQTIFDFYVGDNSVEVIALKGTVSYMPADGTAEYSATAGGPSIIADSRQVTSGDGKADYDWDAFNVQRDGIWANRLSQSDTSMRYLPPSLHDEAYVLEEYGHWERVYYEGAYHRFWRPVRVGHGWAPFTHGHWTVWYEDNCWIPHEPFGYVTHHYGSWVHLGHHWYWVPPKAGRRVGAGPGFAMEYGWYPGRVAWIYSGTAVGWVPLTPYEPYYCHRYWGPRCNTGVYNRRGMDVNRYHYIRHAVIINRDHFYRVTDYHPVRITRFNGFRAAPVVNNAVIANYHTIANKYNFTNAALKGKPHESVTRRIRYNQQTSVRSAPHSGQIVPQDATRVMEAAPVQSSTIPVPVLSHKLVAPNAVRRPESEIVFPRYEIKNGKTKNPQPEVQGAARVSPPSEPVTHRQYRKSPQTPSQAQQITEQPPVTENPPQPSRQQVKKLPGVQPPVVQEIPRTPTVQETTQVNPPSQPAPPRQYRKSPKTPSQAQQITEQPPVTENTPQPSHQQVKKLPTVQPSVVQGQQITEQPTVIKSTSQPSHQQVKKIPKVQPSAVQENPQPPAVQETTQANPPSQPAPARQHRKGQPQPDQQPQTQQESDKDNPQETVEEIK